MAIEVVVPDIGDYQNIPVIEVLVQVGDQVQREQSILTLESDKATMDVPSSHAGIVKEIKVKIGDLLSQGGPVIVLEEAEENANVVDDIQKIASTTLEIINKAKAIEVSVIESSELIASQDIKQNTEGHQTWASPSARKFAREFGVEIKKVSGTGLKGRITREDIQQFIKSAMSSIGSVSERPSAGIVGFDILPWPKVDFAKFGEIECQPRSRIQKVSAANLARNWVMIPAVTYHDDADITDLDAFRTRLNAESKKDTVKITLLAFLIKSAVAAQSHH